MSLGKRLKAKRIAEGLSLRDLEKLVGASFSSLARIERGQGKPTLATEIRVKAWLDHGKRSERPAKKKGWFITFEQRLARIEKHLGLEGARDEQG